jgi:hypothetical protein
VEQELVGQRGEAPRLFVAAHDGLFAHVAAGHYEGFEGARFEEEMVQRGVGQHDAEAGIARRDTWSDRGGDTRIAAAGQQNDGPARIGEQGAVRIVENRDPFGRRGIAHHDGEGLAAAALALAQEIHCCVARRVAGEVKAAEAFDREDRALFQ